jgi:hypothetical protein
MLAQMSLCSQGLVTEYDEKKVKISSWERAGGRSYKPHFSTHKLCRGWEIC